MDSRDYNYYYNLNSFNQLQANPTNPNQAYHHYWPGGFIPPIAATERSPSPSTSSEGNESACSSARKNYDRWSDDEQRYLIELWAEDFDRTESKDARVAWNDIAEKLNKRFNTNRSAELAKKKVKYLVDRYKKAKDWNKNQSGENLKTMPFYDKIDQVLGCRDIVTLKNVFETQSAHSSYNSSSEGAGVTSGQEEPPKETPSTAGQKAQRSQRKKSRKRAAEEGIEDEERKLLRSAVDGMQTQREEMSTFVQNFTRVQNQQLDTMNNLVGALTRFLEKQ